MFETDPFAVVTVVHETAQAVALVGPPSGLPSQVPGFVGDILGEIGSTAGGAMDGIGETIRGLTPGGADSAGEAAANGRGR
ncbi:hypothetical protein [Haloarcula laminariae]|uniref:hypothetical protein n=1 Tax=Haloarcula laminariae TaxID=2961577 RepID=UPI0021C80D46|nr:MULTISPECIES: hypothetical protein [Halomicroarcula]